MCLVHQEIQNTTGTSGRIAFDSDDLQVHTSTRNLTGSDATNVHFREASKPDIHFQIPVKVWWLLLMNLFLRFFPTGRVSGVLGDIGGVLFILLAKTLAECQVCLLRGRTKISDRTTHMNKHSVTSTPSIMLYTHD